MAPAIRPYVATPVHNEESNMRPGAAVSSQTLNSNLCRKPAQLKTLLFASTSFLSAFLLFQVQLIVSKCILPWFGGSAAVWTTSMLVFQILLLGGYIYSHVISAKASAIAQTRIHLVLLLTAFLMVLALSFVWPSAITPDASWKPRAGGDPTRDVMAIILVSTGFPFFVLSTTGPLLQRWFARLGGGSGTYQLYSISNLGSLLGLLTFPFLLEPTLRITIQGRFWSLLFGAFIAGSAVCAWKARNATEETVIEETQARENVGGAKAETPASLITYAMWFLLAACPSSLLLATTNLLCQQVTTVSLLWVLPLSIYLLSFILCFDGPRWYRRSFFHPFFAVILFLTCAGLIVKNILSQAILLPALLFLGCMICHGELVRLKPGVKRLTSFYLTVSAGGAAGGIFVGIVAPHIFTFFTEFQLTLASIVILVLVCLFLDPDSWIYERGSWLPAAITGGAISTAYLAGRRFRLGVPELLARLHFYPAALLIGAVVILGTYILSSSQGFGHLQVAEQLGEPQTQPKKRKPPMPWPAHIRGFRFVQIYVGCLAVLALAALYRSTRSSPEPYLSSRNFYGAVRVFREAHDRVLVHGRTVHGLQLDPPNDRVGTTYYGKNTAIGILLQNHPKRNIAGESLRVGLVGLGAGTLATYGQPGDYFRYYEINPDVVKLSSGPQPVFTYIRDSAARIDVELGDARLLLERELEKAEIQKFDVLVLDAFAGGTVPVHLLTREAFDTYWQHLDPDGIIAVNITSGHIDLSPVLQGATAYFHAASIVAVDASAFPCKNSRWVLLARNAGALNIKGLEQTALSTRMRLPPRLWTDDYSDIFRLERYFNLASFHSFHQ